MTKDRGALVTIIILFLMIPLSSCTTDDTDTGKVGVWTEKIEIGEFYGDDIIDIISCNVTPPDLGECQIVRDMKGGVRFRCMRPGEGEVTIEYRNRQGTHRVTKRITCEN